LGLSNRLRIAFHSIAKIQFGAISADLHSGCATGLAAALDFRKNSEMRKLNKSVSFFNTLSASELLNNICKKEQRSHRARGGIAPRALRRDGESLGTKEKLSKLKQV
jgi:hypothetical protein